MARIRYLYFRPIFQLLSQLCGGGTWLTKAVPTSTAKKPKEVMHFRVWNVTRSGNFFMGVAVCSRQKPNRLLNQYDKKIHSSIFWTFSNLSPQEHCLHNGNCTLTCFIYFLDSLFSSSSKCCSLLALSAARIVAQMTTEMIECYHLR